MSCTITYNPPSVEQQRRRRATISDGRESCPEIDDSCTCIMFARVSADSVYGKKRKRIRRRSAGGKSNVACLFAVNYLFIVLLYTIYRYII